MLSLRMEMVGKKVFRRRGSIRLRKRMILHRGLEDSLLLNMLMLVWVMLA